MSEKLYCILYAVDSIFSSLRLIQLQPPISHSLLRSIDRLDKWLSLFDSLKGKGTVYHTAPKSVGGCSSPCPRPWARMGTTNVCDAWPVRRQTYGYLPSRKASPPIGRYQIILLGDRGTCVLTTCPGLHSRAGWLRFEPATYSSQLLKSSTLPLRHRATQNGVGKENNFGFWSLSPLCWL